MITLACKKHPRYAGKLLPKAACQMCIDLYDILLKAEECHILKRKPSSIKEEN